MATRPVMIRLNDADYSHLAQEAEQLGMRPGTLAKVLLHASLTRERPSAERLRRQRKQALADLRGLVADLPEVDPAELVAQGRRELDSRAK